VRIDSPVPHLDHPFDYAIPALLDEAAQVGSRVRVRFSGRLVDGYIVARADQGEHAGPLRPIDRVVGAEAVLTEQTLALIDAVAERYAGTFSDVVRSAVPPRHARAEAVAVGPTHWSATPPNAQRW
jgi:primosomal protein N' (replication factor Y)